MFIIFSKQFGKIEADFHNNDETTQKDPYSNKGEKQAHIHRLSSEENKKKSTTTTTTITTQSEHKQSYCEVESFVAPLQLKDYIVSISSILSLDDDTIRLFALGIFKVIDLI
jgi:hypothetical protein